MTQHKAYSIQRMTEQIDQAIMATKNTKQDIKKHENFTKSEIQFEISLSLMIS